MTLQFGYLIRLTLVTDIIAIIFVNLLIFECRLIRQTFHVVAVASLPLQCSADTS